MFGPVSLPHAAGSVTLGPGEVPVDLQAALGATVVTEVGANTLARTNSQGVVAFGIAHEVGCTFLSRFLFLLRAINSLPAFLEGLLAYLGIVPIVAEGLGTLVSARGATHKEGHDGQNAR